jgi:hypothetical protein
MSRWIAQVAAPALVLFAAAGSSAGAIPTFELADQHERPHTARALFQTKKPVLVISGDQRKSDREIAAWHKALRRAAVKGAVMRGLVNLEQVPFFVPNALIRRSLRKSNPYLPVLCDYKGKVFKRLRLPAGGVAVTVLDARGRRVGSVRGKASKAGVARVKQLVERGRNKNKP